jgi:hypothetical protein
MANTGSWNYILVFSDEVGTREAVKRFLDSRDEVMTWYYCMSNAIFIPSTYTAKDLQKMFRQFTNDKGRFMILDCNTDRDGWLTKDAWKFMRNEYP